VAGVVGAVLETNICLVYRQNTGAVIPYEKRIITYEIDRLVEGDNGSYRIQKFCATVGGKIEFFLVPVTAFKFRIQGDVDGKTDGVLDAQIHRGAVIDEIGMIEANG